MQHAGSCREFTSLMASAYEDRDDKDEIEIVFSSCDSDLKGFNEYCGMMPWAAIPYEDRERDATLSAKFKVDGIPTLVVLDGATGHVVDPDAGGKVSTAKTLTGIFSN